MACVDLMASSRQEMRVLKDALHSELVVATMKLMSAFLSFVALIGISNGDLPPNGDELLNLCGSNTLTDTLIEECAPYGGIARKRFKKRSGLTGEFPVSHEPISQPMSSQFKSIPDDRVGGKLPSNFYFLPHGDPLGKSIRHRQMPYAIDCTLRRTSAICACCRVYKGPCTRNELIANYCARPTPEFDPYYIRNR